MVTMKFPEIHNPKELSELVGELGFLPFFANEIAGFSIQECCPKEFWFSDSVDGPWEWKGPVIRLGGCIYGKLFRGKAGYVSLDWMPDFVNFRRDGYDFDARYDDGLASHKDKTVYDTLAANGSLLSKELKKLCNYGKDGNKGFDSVITRLQMQTYITTSDFVYMQDSSGKTYGWGVAKYATLEELFGYDAVTSAYRFPPEESKKRIVEHLSKILPDATEKQILKLIK
jgi:hypothetical protein